ncbi:MAG: multicopper oxidase domain-containing protein [Actinomycetota bacterium]
MTTTERPTSPPADAKGSPRTGRRIRRLAVSAALAAVVIGGLAAAVVVFQPFDEGFNGGGFANVVSTETPAVNPLEIPELLEPTMIDGVATYQLSLDASSHVFRDGVASETIAYNQTSVLGPTLLWRTGDQVSLDVTNNLPEEATTTHWHGADVPVEADGGPGSRIDTGDTWTASFEVIQPAATLWYHPHLKDLTAAQVYAGAAGLIIVEDDTAAVDALPHTYGVDDIPIILQDREFDAAGQLDFELDLDDNGDLNPELTVNGTMNPYVDVPAGLVRLRLLNGSQARVYQLSLDTGAAFTKVASDGGFLSRPVELTELLIGPGDRAEIVIDTSDGVVNLIDADFERVVELRPDPAEAGTGRIPDALAVVPRFAPDGFDNERSFVMEAVGEGWGINGQQMDPARIDETIQFGATERWTLSAPEGIHTFHVHQTQFQILEINGAPPPPEDAGWEDTVLVTGDQTVVVAARFDTYTNPTMGYMFHCHILDHEDSGMMGQFQVLDE